VTGPVGVSGLRVHFRVYGFPAGTTSLVLGRSMASKLRSGSFVVCAKAWLARARRADVEKRMVKARVGSER